MRSGRGQGIQPKHFTFMRIAAIGIALLVSFSFVVQQAAFADADIPNEPQAINKNEGQAESQDDLLLGGMFSGFLTVPEFFETIMQGFFEEEMSQSFPEKHATAKTEDAIVWPWTSAKQQQRDLPWNLFLVNPSNPFSEDHEVALVGVEEGHLADERCLEPLQRMLADCRNAGYSPSICSSYRTQQDQEELFLNKVQRLMAQGLSEEEAYQEAGVVVAVPGTSEHQLGLAFDIVDTFDQSLTDDQAYTPTQQWLMEHSWEYGFVLRYPANKTEVTGIIYEPWHYRYVGDQAAREMHESGLCLEEYVSKQSSK